MKWPSLLANFSRTTNNTRWSQHLHFGACYMTSQPGISQELKASWAQRHTHHALRRWLCWDDDQEFSQEQSRKPRKQIAKQGASEGDYFVSLFHLLQTWWINCKASKWFLETPGIEFTVWASGFAAWLREVSVTVPWHCAHLGPPARVHTWWKEHSPSLH